MPREDEEVDVTWMSMTAEQEHPSVTTVTTVTPPKGLFRKRGVLLIDDDPQFCALFLGLAKAHGIPARAYSSLSDMTSFAELRNYDVAVLDYYLQSFKGPEIAEYIDVFFSELPVVVISGGELGAVDRDVWPDCIRQFVAKSRGPYEIIKAALAAVRKVDAV